MGMLSFSEHNKCIFDSKQHLYIITTFLYVPLQLQLRWLSNRSQLPPIPQRSSINRNRLPINISPRATRKIHHNARDILRHTQSPHRVGLANLLRTARQLQQPVGHLAREEARADGVDGDVSRAQLDSEVATQMDHGRLARRVAIRALLAQRADAQPGDRRRDDDAAGIRERGGLLEQRREEADGVEDGLDVQVHDLSEGGVAVRVESFAPCRARVGEQDIHVVGMLLDFVEQVLHPGFVGRVGGDGDGFGAWLEVRERVEGFARAGAGGGFAGGDEDFGGAGLEEAGGRRLVMLWVGAVGRRDREGDGR